MNSDASMVHPEITVIGAGTYGSVIGELAESCGYHVTHYLDDDLSKWGTGLDRVPITGPIDDALRRLPEGCAVAVAVGNNQARLKWLREAQSQGLSIPMLVSPHALVSPKASVADGVYLHPGCHVWTHARLGLGTILSPHATVAHHTIIGDGSFISTGANIGASIVVGEASMFGIGSTVSTGVKAIGENTLVGAGAVIIRDTKAFGVYVGSPGRLIKFQEPGTGDKQKNDSLHPDSP